MAGTGKMALTKDMAGNREMAGTGKFA